ncbi:MAG: mechanosensitive ion channel family protein [Candidatus Glassbacteria bacterium]|nr:mechanosensitive ion channel family protein [Candidatus Glassbacteria bacterium]
MQELMNSMGEYLTQERIFMLVRASAILVVGLIISCLLAGAAGRMAGKYMGEPQKVLFRKLAFYTLVCIVAASVLRELGFKLTVLLGAAGILTVAVGFAAQTSASNVISGLFLLIDKPFKIGDAVKIGGTVGLVESMELISVKLRTFQNNLVRIPNEEVNRSQVENLSYWPLRRIDIDLGVAYKEDPGNVRDALMAVADRNPLCLEEPQPVFVYKGYGDSALEFVFCVWTAKENYLQVMNGVKQGIKEEFDRRGIEIPFPHISLIAGTTTDPFPIELIQREQVRPPQSA